MLHLISRHTHNAILLTLLVFVFSFLGINFLFSSIENYKTHLSNQLSNIIQAPVKIGKLNAKLRGITPQIQLSELDIANEKIHLREIRLGINVFSFLATQNLLSSATVTLIGAKITLVRHVDDSITLEGLKASEGQPTWLLKGNYSLLHSSITWRDDKSKMPARQISPVNLAILNDGEKHCVNLFTQLQKNEPLRISLIFSGNPFDLKTLNGKIYLESKNLKLREFAELELPLHLKISDGVVDVKAWANLQNGQFQTLNGNAKFQYVVLNRPEHSTLKFNQLSSDFQIQKQNEIWKTQFLNLELLTPETALNGAVSAMFNENNLADNNVGLFLKNVEIAPLIPIANFFTEKQISLNKFSGTLENLRIFTQLEQKKIAVDSNFKDLKINIANLNLQHLNGHLKGNEQSGTLVLNAEKFAFHAPTLFREVLPDIELQTTLNWVQTPESWRIFSDKIILNNRDIPSESTLKLTIPKNGEPFMDLQTAFEIHDATQTWRYLPVGIMEKEVIEWLDRAFEKGQVKNGQFLFYGLLKDFPFEKNNGVFEVVFDAENGRLNYAPDWLPIDDLTAKVRFYQDSLQVNLSGMAQNVILKSAEATIPSMFTSNHVGIVGEVEGEISQVLDLMQKTPLKSRVDSVLTAISPQGKTSISLDLLISIADNVNSKINSSAAFKNAKLKVKALDLSVQEITGTLKFTEQGVFSDKIDAITLNYPIQIYLKSDDTDTNVNVVGSTSVDDLFSQLGFLSLTKLNGNTPWIEGVTDYQLTLTLPYDEDVSPTLKIQSMLSGVSLNLPTEIAKEKWQKIPFLMTLTLGNEAFLPLNLNYNELLKADVILDTKNKKIERGMILLGDGEANLPKETGLSLKISRNNLILENWLKLAAVASSESNAESIHTVVIQSQNAIWEKANLGGFDLTLKHENEGWRGNLKNSFVTGIVQIQNDSTLNLELEKFDLAIFKKFQNRATSEDFSEGNFSRNNAHKNFLLSLQSSQAFWNDKPLGKLNIELTQNNNGIQFKTIELQAATHRLSMTGESDLQTKLHGTLEFFKAGNLFSTLEITKDIAETKGSAKLDLNWQGSLQEFSLEKLQGEIDLELQNGRILSIEPGLGRVLGVLALEQWLKRIQLDFSDVYSEGLTFDSIGGHFDISRGKASTQNLMVNAIPARILLKGDTDFVHERVDYLIDVMPKSADAVPIAGTIVGKIMSLVGKTLTGENQDGFFFGSQYRINGSWGNIDVTPIHENDGLIQKTWRGITDFSWLNQKLNSKEVSHD